MRSDQEADGCAYDGCQIHDPLVCIDFFRVLICPRLPPPHPPVYVWGGGCVGVGGYVCVGGCMLRRTRGAHVSAYICTHGGIHAHF